MLQGYVGVLLEMIMISGQNESYEMSAKSSVFNVMGVSQPPTKTTWPSFSYTQTRCA